MNTKSNVKLIPEIKIEFRDAKCTCQDLPQAMCDIHGEQKKLSNIYCGQCGQLIFKAETLELIGHYCNELY